MGQIKNIKLHIVTDIKGLEHRMNGMTAKTLFLMTLMDAAVFITNQKHCLPGHHPQHDTVTGETRCEECPAGMFSKKGRQCLLCSVCHQAQSEVRGCTRSGNRVCRCPPGTYLKKGAICAQCSTCTRGMVETHTCAHDMNRACRLCPSGHTTNANNVRVSVYRNTLWNLRRLSCNTLWTGGLFYLSLQQLSHSVDVSLSRVGVSVGRSVRGGILCHLYDTQR